MKSDTTYDYIIAGMGCAGLSLAIQLKRSLIPFKMVLLVDKDLKKSNDRTWCFWTKKEPHWFDDITCKRWNQLWVYGENEKVPLHMGDYNYRMIRGHDFYEYCLKELKSDARFEIISDSINEIQCLDDKAILKTHSNEYSANYIFNSAIRTLVVKPGQVNYVQHFKGWLIETEQEFFNTETPVFMDFGVEQHQDCRFVYVIPYSKKKALIEYTGFSELVLSDEEYEQELKKYVEQKLKISKYTIIETERGIIPMTEGKFTNPLGKRIVNIGTAGGSSKASTGFTFIFIQKHISDLIWQLQNGNTNLRYGKGKIRFVWYDKLLLRVIHKKETPVAELFLNLFRKNSAVDLLAFLNEESTFSQELRIMKSVNRTQFLKALFP